MKDPRLPASEFLDRPGLPGPFGALMDEYARAAADYCRVLETFAPGAFGAERPSKDPHTRSPRAIGLHVHGAARRYADYVRKARGLPFVERFDPPADALPAPGAMRGLLADALRYTEGALEGLHGADEATVEAIRFQVRWGPTYDPEMILEHGIVHLLRHRRQLERWDRVPLRAGRDGRGYSGKAPIVAPSRPAPRRGESRRRR